jgi:transposase
MMSPAFLTWNQRLTWIVTLGESQDMGRMARTSAPYRRLMTIPKVGQLTALAFVAHPQSVDTSKSLRPSH